MVDQNSIFGGMLTTLGAAKKTNCDALGIPWEPRYMLIGDANGTDPVPSPTQTKLINQRYHAQLNQLYVSPTDENVLIAELVLPPDVGGWWIRELALEDKDGVFSAVANVAPSYKPLLAQGSGRNQVVRMHIITSGTSNIQLKIDPSVVLATRKYVDDSIKTLYSKAEIEAMIAEASALPVGTMAAFPVNKIPPGFLELDGSVKSIAIYPDLAAFLGTDFNKGDEGVGNFRVPESRGEFLRGWDHGRGVDAGRAVGSWQKPSVHVFDTGTSVATVSDRNTVTSAVTALANMGYDSINAADYPGAEYSVSTAGTSAPISNSDQTAFGATRPRNLAVIWCIKAWNAPINQGNIDIAALEALATQATEIKFGTAKIATQSQVEAGANDTTIVTPQKLLFGFTILLAAIGYIVFPKWLGGLKIQWGTTAILSATSGTVTFPMAFDVAAYYFNPIKHSNDGRRVAAMAPTKLNVAVYGWAGNGNAAIIDNFSWLAVGI
ncbi:phage tail protein [Pseudomonas iranensis]|uniref:phage tail protein n=1 Tax=Pseudomonas iranensis TaxID=2745503 RepID=UPI001647BE16|nr:phage tail protein [Pseudomonas iranensis]